MVSGGEDYTVVGGSHGIEADLEDMDHTGSRIRHTGWEAGDQAVATHSFLVDPNLLSSVVLAPGTFGSFEATLLGALDGPRGLSANAVRMTASGTFMQAKAKAYAATDRALEYTQDVQQHLQGMSFGVSLAVAPVPTALVAGGELWGEGFFDDPERWAVEHPDDVEEIVASAPGFIDLFLPGTGFPGDAQEGAALLALLYDQSGTDPVTDGPYETPASADLGAAMKKLEVYADDVDQFKIEQVGEGADAVYNVYLPGTKEFDSPFAESGIVQNMGTNLAGVGGADNAYEQAVVAALEQMGVPPDAPLNFMGHSQGGIIAARLAQKLTDPSSGLPQYDVTSVVTAGSPVDSIDLPENVQMLSLVNEYDVVPRLDGEHYDDHSNHTTIVTEVQNGTATGNHLMKDVYTEMAADLTTSEDPAVRDALSPSSAFWGDGPSTTWSFQMGRP